MPVQQADADQRQAQVAGGLEVIAGQDAEATRVDLHDLGDPELGGEVGHPRRGRGLRLRPTGTRQVALKVRADLGQLPHEGLVPHQLRHAGPRQPSEEGHRVAADLLPQLLVSPLQHLTGRRIPRPSEVVGQLRQRIERRG